MSTISSWERAQNPSLSSCSICLSDQKKDFVSHKTEQKTNHTFHRSCIKEWAKTSGALDCPLCREKVEIGVLHYRHDPLMHLAKKILADRKVAIITRTTLTFVLAEAAILTSSLIGNPISLERHLATSLGATGIVLGSGLLEVLVAARSIKKGVDTG